MVQFTFNSVNLPSPVRVEKGSCQAMSRGKGFSNSTASYINLQLSFLFLSPSASQLFEAPSVSIPEPIWCILCYKLANSFNHSAFPRQLNQLPLNYLLSSFQNFEDISHVFIFSSFFLVPCGFTS